MDRVCLLHWNRKEGQECLRVLESLGYVAVLLPADPAHLFKQLSSEKPAALIVDLTRLPSQGREVAVAVRRRKSTRNVPLIFVGGEERKVERIRTLLPDAGFCDWKGIQSEVVRALAEPVENPVVPESGFAAYATRPLAGKLGIQEGSTVCLLGAPEGFEAVLGGLPRNVRLARDEQAEPDLMMWFVPTRLMLEKDLERVLRVAGDAPIWMAWPKKSSGVPSDLTQQQIRERGLAAGLVDYKICSIDSIWSGLLFRRRKGGP